MSATNDAADVVTRWGRVRLTTGGHGRGPFWASFLVRERADGSVEYMLGGLARTSDGWVTLDAEHHARITWDAARPQATTDDLDADEHARVWDH